MITFKDFVFSTDYTNPEKHISVSIYNDNHDKNPYDDFVDIDVNIKNVLVNGYVNITGVCRLRGKLRTQSKLFRLVQHHAHLA